jgi:hypothetical protein
MMMISTLLRTTSPGESLRTGSTTPLRCWWRASRSLSRGPGWVSPGGHGEHHHDDAPDDRRIITMKRRERELHGHG